MTITTAQVLDAATLLFLVTFIFTWMKKLYVPLKTILPKIVPVFNLPQGDYTKRICLLSWIDDRGRFHVNDWLVESDIVDVERRIPPWVLIKSKTNKWLLMVDYSSANINGYTGPNITKVFWPMGVFRGKKGRLKLRDELLAEIKEYAVVFEVSHEVSIRYLHTGVNKVPDSTSSISAPELYSRREGWTANSWGYKPRDPSTILVEDSIKERCEEYIKNFNSKEREERQLRTGQPHTAAMIVSGPPGTGKTSFAQWLAYKLGRDLGIISSDRLASLSDTGFLGQGIRISDLANCLLMVEDIDRSFKNGAKKRISKTDEAGNVFEGETSVIDIDVSGLLNAIDGNLATPNQFVLMTANNISHLPIALTSRCLCVTITYPTVDVCVEFFERFYGTDKFNEAFRKMYETQTHLNLTIRDIQKFLEPRSQKPELAIEEFPSKIKEEILYVRSEEAIDELSERW